MILADQYSIREQFKEEQGFFGQEPVEKAFNNQANKKRQLAKRKGLRNLLAMIVGGVLSLVVANIIFQALLIQRNQEVKVWQTRLAKLERRAIKLRIEMADLGSFERIQTAAQRDLGMKLAGPDDYLCIAAAPEKREGQQQTYETYTSKSVPQGNLWTKLADWLEGIGQTMAQTP